jgi:hypothetical protein
MTKSSIRPWRNAYNIMVGKSKANQLKDLCIDGRIILN